MFEIDVPIKGEVFLKQRLNPLYEELDNSSDPGYLKSNYRTFLRQLIDRIETNYDSDFWSEVEWIWNHLHELSMVGDIWISDTEYQESKPVYKGFSDIADQFRIYIDVHSPISEINFSVEVYETLYHDILKAKGNCLMRPIATNQTLKTAYAGRYQDLKKRLNEGDYETIYFDHERALKTLEKIYRITLTTYKDRIYLETLSKALDYRPGSNQGGTRSYFTKSEKNQKSTDITKINDFFDLIRTGEITQEIDILNHIKKITNNFSPDQLQMLCNAYDNYALSKPYKKSQIELHLKRKKGEITKKRLEEELFIRNKPELLIEDYFSGKYEQKVKDIREFYAKKNKLYPSAEEPVEKLDANVDYSYLLRDLLIKLREEDELVPDESELIKKLNSPTGKKELMIEFRKTLTVEQALEKLNKLSMDKIGKKAWKNTQSYYNS